MVLLEEAKHLWTGLQHAKRASVAQWRDLGAHALRFKLHLAINDRGEILNVALTSGNIDERRPVKELLRKLSGHFYGERTQSRPVPCYARSDANGIALYL